MSGARTRRQAALAAAADETPTKTDPKLQPETEEQVVINGNGTALAEDASEAPRSKENIFVFIPNLIGTHLPFFN